MIKRSLLAVSIAALGAQSALATPFLPMDARGLAMGNTGVASALRAHAPIYNPSLLSQAHESEDFSIMLQLGVNLADEEGLVDEANDIGDDIFPRFEELFDDDEPGSFAQNIEDLSDSANDLSTAINDLQTAVESNNPTAIIASANAAETANSNLGDSLDEVNEQLNEVNSVTAELNDSLSAISGSPLRGRLGIGAALAIPSKKFAAAITINADVHSSARALFSQQDQNLIAAYGQEAQSLVNLASDTSDDLDTLLDNVRNSPLDPNLPQQIVPVLNSVNDVANYTSDTPIDTAAGNILLFENGELSEEATDPDLNSQVQIKAVGVAEAGLSISREFSFFGEKLAIGITPKIQKIETFHLVSEIDNEEDIEEDDIEDSRTSYTKSNVDVGLSYRMGENWVLGVVGKNLVSHELDVADAEVLQGPGEAPAMAVEGGTIALNPQYRAGLAYNGDWITVAADVDLKENESIAFEKPTQYAAVGAELDVFDTIQLRAGYRTNMSGSDDEVVSVGAGFSPFFLHIDLAVMANPNKPEKEAGAALELGFFF